MTTNTVSIALHVSKDLDTEHELEDTKKQTVRRYRTRTGRRKGQCCCGIQISTSSRQEINKILFDFFDFLKVQKVQKSQKSQKKSRTFQ